MDDANSLVSYEVVGFGVSDYADYKPMERVPPSPEMEAFYAQLAEREEQQRVGALNAMLALAAVSK